ncbi:MAG: sigma 54-interacting transcriptional regulator [Syntrophales bacterium]
MAFEPKQERGSSSRSISSFTIDKDKLIKSMFRISTFLTAPSHMDQLSQTLFMDEFPFGDFQANPPSSLADIMIKILDEVVDSLGFDRGIICLLDESKENLITKVAKNYDPEETDRAFSFALNLKKHDCFETRVAKTGQYLVLEDSETDPRLTETDWKITQFYKRGSTFYAPLNIEDEVIGIIAVWTKAKTRFSPEEIEILLTYANQVSIVIYLTRLFENKRDKFQQLLILQKAVSELNSNYVLDQIHEILSRYALKLSHAEKALIYFLDVENNRCLIHDGENVWVDNNNEYIGRIEQSIIKRALETNVITVKPFSSEQSASSRPLFAGCLSEMAIPFKIRDKFKGALYLGKGEGIYSQDQINALDILTKNAATSYDNAIMYSMLSLEAQSLKSEVEKLKEREDMLLGFQDILGKSEQMRNIFRIIQEVAKHDTNILIQGESGTGKELIARAIHRQSSRNVKRFVEVNCAAIPGTLLESELFGYEAGAFTDAKKKKIGLLEYASGGTLLLDEIGDMSLPLQAKFLRMLENGYIRRLGGNENIPVDVRFIFSTNKDLTRMVAEASFREDLFYRIRVVPIMIPPLRERADDILLLARHYVREFNKKFNKKVMGFSKEAEKILKQYPWPGNVRELKNIIERIMIMQHLGKLITPADLPAEIKIKDLPDLKMDIESFAQFPKDGMDYKLTVEQITNEIKRKIIFRALKKGNGKKAAAARFLGISRYTFIRELKKLGRFEN